VCSHRQERGGYYPLASEHELNAERDTNEDCAWPWVTPVEVLSAPVLDPDAIREAGAVPFEDVLDDIERFEAVETHAGDGD